MPYPPAPLPTNNADATPAGAGYHADELHNAVNRAVNDIVTILGDAPQGTAETLQARLEGLSGTYVRAWAPATFVALGDSITSDGGRVQNNASAPAASVTKHSWHFWAQLLSNSRLIWAGSFGAASQTIAQIKNTYLPYLLALSTKPDYCVVLAGQNDLGSVNAATLADYTSIVTQLRNAGITPILCTLTPSVTSINIHILNAHIRALAHTYGLPLVDLHGAVISSSTGTWQASLARDAVHPNEAGAYTMGAALAAVIDGIKPVNANAAWLPKTNTGYTGARGTGTGGNTNPLLLTDNGATPPIPTNWSILQGSHASAIAFSTPGGSIAGRKATLTASATPLIARLFAASATAVAGDRFLVAFRMSAAVQAADGSFGFTVLDGSGGSIYDAGRNNTSYHTRDFTDKTFVIPVTTPNTSLFVDFIVNGSGAAIAVSEIVAVNLTGLGVAV